MIDSHDTEPHFRREEMDAAGRPSACDLPHVINTSSTDPHVCPSRGTDPHVCPSRGSAIITPHH